jgi:hypothetical protein
MIWQGTSERYILNISKMVALVHSKAMTVEFVAKHTNFRSHFESMLGLIQRGIQHSSVTFVAKL